METMSDGQGKKGVIRTGFVVNMVAVPHKHADRTHGLQS